ncbi:MAG: hemolysin family protein [Paracoccus sp. (in: a-proteobacteria)]|uniref:hemolysin family protein n=3 Tax=Paracoccus TaxID=265 RepID=UPI000C62928F|nr:hemolysin family protein [Paracoccus sp. (in: a-proteobacteria)]MBA49451.1 magnesium/cobalt efflux protein [Paracoccus sp. (in: a-proteobacteria)]MCS5600571.1 hemolysin family protein [Paracoccus sp. (in: a-proteobacteria)]|tara:strand:+ start:218 stop:1198 length:981 start_codon:yes stop_codon:yes gene_type:complete
MNSETRLSARPLGADAASEADGVGGEGRDLPQSRGFFGRFFDALTGSEEDEAGDEGDRPVAQPAPGMVNLRRMRVDDVAIPKAEIIAAPLNVTLNDLVEMFREHGFSRIPVFRGTLDSPLGLIHLKDLALKHGFGTGGKFTLRPMLRPMLYVPPSMPIGVLLQQMQQKRTHMALVIDEYGGVDGLVTIEDLIEQVIGEIEDEHDEAEGRMWIKEKPAQWLIQARAPLNEVEAETGLRLASDDEDDEIDTLGGLIFMLAGRIPLRGEVIAHDSGVEFEVVEADPRRIKRVRMRAPGATASAPDAPRKRPAPQNAEQNAEDQIASETG